MDKNLNFRMFVYKEEDDTFTAVCLDLDIIEEGFSSMDSAILSIRDAVSSHLEIASKLGFPKELIQRSAPKEYWKKLDELLKPKRKQNNPFSLTSGGYNHCYA